MTGNIHDKYEAYAWHRIPLQTISIIYYAQLSYYKCQTTTQ